MNSMGCMNLLPTTKNAPPSDSHSSPSASSVSSCGVDANSYAGMHTVSAQSVTAPAVVQTCNDTSAHLSFKFRPALGHFLQSALILFPVLQMHPTMQPPSAILMCSNHLGLPRVTHCMLSRSQLTGCSRHLLCRPTPAQPAAASAILMLNFLSFTPGMPALLRPMPHCIDP